MARRRTPWRENIEAATVAVLLAVLFKYFLVEFYRIPSGSMQPTLYGSGPPLELYDRVLADKLSFHLRDPERFEVVIFRYPLDRSKNFVKRLVGLPGEQLKLENGDLWVRSDPGAAWRIPRRPAGVMAGQWRRLLGDRAPQRWRVRGPRDAPAPAWRVSAGDIEARGSGVAEFVGHGSDSIYDVHGDGYPPALAAVLGPPPPSGHNAVGDLRLSGELRALPGCTWVTFEIEEGELLHRFHLPGPAAAPSERARLESAPRPGRRSAAQPVGAVSPGALRLQAGRPVRFEAANLDDRLSLRLDGRECLALEVAGIARQDSSVRIEIAGEGADLTGLELARDVYYAGGRTGSSWTIPAGHYFMLGDNTQDSSDSRDWMRATLAWRDEQGREREAAGNWRAQGADGPIPGETNPVRTPGGDGPGRTFLRDEWGEPHHFESARELSPALPDPIQPSPFVPRELITGRALASLWPLRPSLGVWRPVWIR